MIGILKTITSLSTLGALTGVSIYGQYGQGPLADDPLNAFSLFVLFGCVELAIQYYRSIYRYRVLSPSAGIHPTRKRNLRGRVRNPRRSFVWIFNTIKAKKVRKYRKPDFKPQRITLGAA